MEELAEKLSDRVKLNADLLRHPFHLPWMQFKHSLTLYRI